MAQHNPQSRTYLIVFLVATVVCFAAAKAIMSGGHDKSHAAADHGGGHAAEASSTSHTGSASEGAGEPHKETGSHDGSAEEALDEAKP
ncbi:MAG: hypothetical protein AAGF13_06610 [Pseudomonadota bacterium]